MDNRSPCAALDRGLTTTARVPYHHTMGIQKQGSGFVGESTIDAVVGVTLVDFDGEIRHYHAPDPDVKARDRSMCVMLGVGGRACLVDLGSSAACVCV